jgi:Flp pilus assembly protein TadG
MSKVFASAGLSEKSQALVEFAIVGLLLFIVVFGVIDVGRAVWNYNTLAHATREGARYAIVHGQLSSDPSGPGSPYYTSPNQDSKVTEAVQQFAGGLDHSRLTVDAEWLDGSNSFGRRVKVTSRYGYAPIFLSLLPIPSITMTSSSTMEITY